MVVTGGSAGRVAVTVAGGDEDGAMVGLAVTLDVGAVVSSKATTPLDPQPAVSRIADEMATARWRMIRRAGAATADQADLRISPAPGRSGGSTCAVWAAGRLINER
jgi:hypothetical protein